MIVAKRVVENLPQKNENKNNKKVKKQLKNKLKNKKQKTPNLEAKNTEVSKKVILCISLVFACLGLIGAVFCVYLNNFTLIKPNIMPPNYVFYIILALYTISSLCFILQNYKEFNFDVTFSLCLTFVLLALLFLFIYYFNFKYLTLTIGILLFICSNALYASFNKKTKKSTSPFLIAHLINIYLTFVAVLIYLVN